MLYIKEELFHEIIALYKQLFTFNKDSLDFEKFLSSIYSERYKREELTDNQQIKTLCINSPKIIYYCLKNIKDYSLSLFLITTVIESLAKSRLDSELTNDVCNLLRIINPILPDKLVSSRTFITDHSEFYIDLDKIMAKNIIPIRNNIVAPAEDLFQLEELLRGDDAVMLRKVPVKSIFNEKSPHSEESLKNCVFVLDYISQELIGASLIAQGIV